MDMFALEDEIETLMESLLTEGEVETLTDYKKPALQQRQLQKMGIPFAPGRTGKPKVLRDAVSNRLRGDLEDSGSTVDTEASSRV